MLKVNDKVLCNGYEGTITEIHEWDDNEMADVRLNSGGVCVAISELTKIVETKHTPLPWIYKHREACGFICAGKHDTSFLPEIPGSSREDAEFIVKACNSHYELLEECEKAYKVMSELSKTLPIKDAKKLATRADIFNLAIQKAKGE